MGVRVSTTFSKRGGGRRFPSINLNSVNAAEVLRWLGVDPHSEHGLVGEIEAKELAALCRRRLWPEKRNETPAVEGGEVPNPGGCRFILGSRDANYHQEKALALLALSERILKRQKKGVVIWS